MVWHVMVWLLRNEPTAMAKETVPQTSWIEPTILVALEAGVVVILTSFFFYVLIKHEKMYYRALLLQRKMGQK